jgi:co-chaperonin GroES (HSP10)
MAKLVVVAVGTSKDIPEEVKPGCRVWATAHSAKAITLDGKDYFAIKSADLLAVQTA